MHLVMLIKDEELRAKAEGDISNLIDIGVVSVHSTEDCLGLFDLIPDIEVIIFDEFFQVSLINSLKKHKKIVDLLFVGKEKITDSLLNIHCFDSSTNIGEYLYGNKAHPNTRFNLIDEKELYYPIISDTLKKMESTPVDVFLRMRKDKYFHYIKFILAGSSIDEKSMEKLNKVEKVFIKNEDKELFFKEMNSLFVKLLGSNPQNYEVNVKEEIFNQLISVGLSENPTKVAEATINNVVDSLKGGALSEIKKIMKSEASMNFRKSFMTSIISTSLAKELSWITHENKSSLVLSAFFNDRMLVRDSMQFILTEYGVEVSDYAPDEKKIIREHAKLAADWVASQKNIPSEVERIIRQHHGSPSGVGFYEDLNAQITKLTMVFIVAEEFSLALIKHKDGKLNVAGTLEDINKKYKNKMIKGILESLFKVLKSS